MAFQPDNKYTATATPNFNAGGAWVAAKQRDRLVVNFARPAPKGAAVDVMIGRDPFRGSGAAK